MTCSRSYGVGQVDSLPWGDRKRLHSATVSHMFTLIQRAHLQVVNHEPGAMVGLTVSRPDGTELRIELPLDTEQATSGDAFAVLHAMW